jgi:hypothetical protein
VVAILRSRGLHRTELRALYAYLQSLPPLPRG